MVPACTCYMWCRGLCVSPSRTIGGLEVSGRARESSYVPPSGLLGRATARPRAPSAPSAPRDRGRWRDAAHCRRRCGSPAGRAELAVAAPPKSHSLFRVSRAARRVAGGARPRRVRAFGLSRYVGRHAHKRMFLFLFQRMISAGFYSAWRFLARTLYTPLTTVRCDIQHKSLPRVPCTRPLEGRCQCRPISTTVTCPPPRRPPRLHTSTRAPQIHNTLKTRKPHQQQNTTRTRRRNSRGQRADSASHAPSAVQDTGACRRRRSSASALLVSARPLPLLSPQQMRAGDAANAATHARSRTAPSHRPSASPHTSSSHPPPIA